VGEAQVGSWRLVKPVCIFVLDGRNKIKAPDLPTCAKILESTQKNSIPCHFHYSGILPADVTVDLSMTCNLNFKRGAVDPFTGSFEDIGVEGKQVHVKHVHLQSTERDRPSFCCKHERL